VAKKQVTAIVKIQIPAGKATPAPPVGTALGPHGLNIMEFVKQYNAATESMAGTIVPVEITVFNDRTFTFVLKTPPAPILIKKAAGVERGAQKVGSEIVGQLTMSQVTSIAEQKMPDLNANDIESAKLQIMGTARSMGIKIVD
jgi:large subunit ribosomal protein L11